jgi:hypothetical protein
MTEPRSDDRSQARQEAAILLGVDIEHLSAADGLRIDMISALRLVIDHEQAAVLDGAAADLGKLNVAVASLIALLPNRELPKAASSREDPRKALFDLIMQQRERDGIPDEGTTQATINAQAAEIAQLRAQLAGEEPTVTAYRVIRKPGRPEADIVPPSELGDFHIGGPKPGPDDPRPPVVIEGKAVATNDAPEPAPAAEDAVDLRAGYNDRPEPWREYSNRHYDPWADNRE